MAAEPQETPSAAAPARAGAEVTVPTESRVDLAPDEPLEPLARPSAAEELASLRESGLHRRMRTVEGAQGPRVKLDGAEVLLLCSNNYLGLAEHPKVRIAGAQGYRDYGAGSGASRLISGNMAPHRSLERRLAAFHEQEEALLFGSGYLANTGVIATLAGRGRIVYSDALNHASIIDGCRLSGAAKFIYRHRDVEHLAWAMERTHGHGALIVSDGIFSMDGDVAPLIWLLELARRHGCRLLVDEAHALGTYGPGGRGTVADAGLAGEVDVITGTLGKALGSYGAYASTSAELRDLLINKARPLIFSTGLPPACALAAEAALELIESEGERVAQLQTNAAVMRQALRGHGLETGDSESQIIPVLVGDPQRALAASTRALDGGVYAQAIRPPTVPEGTSRLRLSVMASHRPSELTDAARVIAEAIAAVSADGDWSLEIPEPSEEPRIFGPQPGAHPVGEVATGDVGAGAGEIRITDARADGDDEQEGAATTTAG